MSIPPYRITQEIKQVIDYYPGKKPKNISSTNSNQNKTYETLPIVSLLDQSYQELKSLNLKGNESQLKFFCTQVDTFLQVYFLIILILFFFYLYISLCIYIYIRLLKRLLNICMYINQ